jgi:hypothetical protein
MRCEKMGDAVRSSAFEHQRVLPPVGRGQHAVNTFSPALIVAAWSMFVVSLTT